MHQKQGPHREAEGGKTCVRLSQVFHQKRPIDWRKMRAIDSRRIFKSVESHYRFQVPEFESSSNSDPTWNEGTETIVRKASRCDGGQWLG